MTTLFKKAAFFTDLHLGAKSNSDLHNEDCLAFVKWFIQTAKEENCDTCFFLGDYHNNRNTMNLRTMGYALQCLELLSKAFDVVHFIPGNHDIFHRDKRDVYSTSWAKHIPNINIVNDFFMEGDVSIVPWLVGDDYKKIQKINAKYMLGHFELPNFYMNSLVKMPDHGDFKVNQLGHIDKVFSGHFHKRQTSKNVTYIGNAFPHNYADAGDDERGMMILEWGNEPVFKSWPNQPRFRVYNLSEVITEPEKYMSANMYCKIALDMELSYEEASLIKETFVDEYKLRELALIPAKTELSEMSSELDSSMFESVDTIVTTQLLSIDKGQYDPKILLDLYKAL